MTTTSDTNYGSTLKFNSVAVDQCQVIDWPEVSTGKSNVTNHGSGGYAESIPNGLVVLGDMTVSIVCDAAIYRTIEGHIAAGLVAPVIITDEHDTFTCNGYWLSIKKEGADAASPEAIKATGVIALTGQPTIIATV